MYIFILMVAAIVAWAVYQYKVEKKARQARYDKVRKRTDMSKPYHPLTNTGWSRGNGSGNVELPIHHHLNANPSYTSSTPNHPANQHYHDYYDAGSSSSSCDSSYSDSGSSSSNSGGSCD